MWVFALLLTAGGFGLEPPPVPPSASPRVPGPVLAFGGGSTPAAVYQAALARAGGRDARVVVIPWSTKGKRRGEKDTSEWQDAGARDVVNAGPMTAPEAHEAVAQADIIWLGGGAQLRLMEALEETKLVAAIRARHEAGALVGGTSAGAAALSELMLSGQPKPEPLLSGAMKTYRGLGLLPTILIDQHFVRWKRNNRLITAVLDNPTQVGVGLDEDTGVFIHNGDLEVVGDGTVHIYDARAAEIRDGAGRPGAGQAARGIILHVLRRGMRWPVPPETRKP